VLDDALASQIGAEDVMEWVVGECRRKMLDLVPIVTLPLSAKVEHFDCMLSAWCLKE